MIYCNSNITNGEALRLCCDNNSCSTSCSYSYSWNADCVKINSLIFCISSLSLCRGIIGNEPITSNNALGGNCVKHNVSISRVTDYLSTLLATNFTGLEQGYASYGFPSGSFPGLGGCNWDNDGWTCSGFAFLVSNSCFIQWPAPWPGPADKNPSPSAVTTTNSSFTPTSTLTPPFEDNPHLAEKIAIPIGTTIGVGSASGLAYYLWRRKKKQTQKQENEVVELATINQLNTSVAKSNHEKEFEQLITQTKRKIGVNLEVALETFLDTQKEIAEGNNAFAIRQLQREAKEKLQTKLSPTEIDNLVQKQTELIQLQQQTQQVQVGRSQQQAQIEVNPYLAFKD